MRPTGVKKLVNGVCVAGLLACVVGGLVPVAEVAGLAGMVGGFLGAYITR